MASSSGSSSLSRNTREEGRLLRLGILLGGVGNVVLTIAKLVVGILFHSEALVADGVHSAADVGVSIAVAIGVRVARAPADWEHPYGHAKAESIAQKIVGILLILAGVELLVRDTQSLLAGGPALEPGLPALWVAIGSLVLKELLYRQNRYVAARSHSQAMMAFAVDHRADVWASLAASLGILGSRAGYTVLDPLAGAVVSLLIIKAGWDLVARAVGDLMDGFNDSEFLGAIQTMALGVGGVRRVEGIRARRMGASVLLDLEIAVSGDISVRDGHRVAREVQTTIRRQKEEVAAVHVHVNPDPP